MVASDEYCPAVVGNLWKARKIRAHMSIIFGREGANPRVPGMFFKEVMQAVLLLGEETWVMNPAWAGPWGGSTIGYIGGSLGGSPGSY